MPKRLPIKGYEGFYEIDSEGKVFTVERTYENSLGRTYKVNSMERKPVIAKTGYALMSLSKRGDIKSYRYHRLVAEALIPNPDNKPYVNHKDGDKLNNHPSNLEWVSAKENTAHAVSYGLMDSKGVSNPACKWSYEDVVDWYVLLTYGVLIQDICTLYGCSKNVVPRLIKAELGDVLPRYRGRPRYYGLD